MLDYQYHIMYLFFSKIGGKRCVCDTRESPLQQLGEKKSWNYFNVSLKNVKIKIEAFTPPPGQKWKKFNTVTLFREGCIWNKFMKKIVKVLKTFVKSI